MKAKVAYLDSRQVAPLLRAIARVDDLLEAEDAEDSRIEDWVVVHHSPSRLSVCLPELMS